MTFKTNFLSWIMYFEHHKSHLVRMFGYLWKGISLNKTLLTFLSHNNYPKFNAYKYFNHSWHQIRKRSWLAIQLLCTVTNTTSQDTTQHIPGGQTNNSVIRSLCVYVCTSICAHILMIKCNDFRNTHTHTHTFTHITCVCQFTYTCVHKRMKILPSWHHIILTMATVQEGLDQSDYEYIISSFNQVHFTNKGSICLRDILVK